MPMRNFLLRWLINVAGLYAATYLHIPGLTYEGDWVSLLGLALIFGLVNAFIRPIVSFLTCSLIILTLGLFTIVINAIMLWLASDLGQQVGIHFVVANFKAAILGALVISVVSFVLTMLFRDERKRDRR
jgi:putative membrane protein